MVQPSSPASWGSTDQSKSKVAKIEMNTAAPAPKSSTPWIVSVIITACSPPRMT